MPILWQGRAYSPRLPYEAGIPEDSPSSNGEDDAKEG
jgi:hypothetical protein